MSQAEWAIIRRLVSRLIRLEASNWANLRHEVAQGPYFTEWPGYIAALEMLPTAKRLIANVPEKDKEVLRREWYRRSEDLFAPRRKFDLQQYANVLIEKTVTRAQGTVFR